MSRNPPVNMQLVDSIVSLISSLNETDRRMVLQKLPSDPQQNRPPSLIGLGRAGASQLSRAELVDYCKRLEYCYREWPGHKGKKPFVPFDRTEKLCLSIAESYSEDTLENFVKHMERVFERGEWGGFMRPERMLEHFQAWLELGPPSPAQ